MEAGRAGEGDDEEEEEEEEEDGDDEEEETVAEEEDEGHAEMEDGDSTYVLLHYAPLFTCGEGVRS